MEFILNTIFWTLAFYGLFEIIKNIIYISTYTNFKSDGIYLIIATKNQEDKIEGFLRSTLFKLLYGREEYLKKCNCSWFEINRQHKRNCKEIVRRIWMLESTKLERM